MNTTKITIHQYVLCIYYVGTLAAMLTVTLTVILIVINIIMI